ncbi:MAG: response regulator [Proteobacteria bacterium]|nr:response regulator [Pseudomonadota bacterium]
MTTHTGDSLPPIIVLAEDDDALRGLITGLLKSNFADHEILAFPDGVEADAALQQMQDQRRQVAMVVSDLVMPRMDGLELFERSAERDPNCARVILTGQGAMESAVQSLRMGVDDYLTKPFTQPELVRTLKRHLETRALQRSNERLQQELAHTHRYVARITEALLARFDRNLEPILELPQVTAEQRRGAMRARRAMDLVARAYRGDQHGTETVQLSTLLDSSIRSLIRDYDLDEDAITVVAPPRDPLLRVDVASARLALGQLLHNAVRSGTGRVEVTLLGEGRNWPSGIQESDLPVAVRLQLSRGFVAVAIRNTAGLTRDDEGYIRRVLRGRADDEDEFRGLGLPLARLYTTLLGGRIVFQWRSTRSEVTFTMLLPTGRN